MTLTHLNTFLQIRLLFHEPNCIKSFFLDSYNKMYYSRVLYIFYHIHLNTKREFVKGFLTFAPFSVKYKDHGYMFLVAFYAPLHPALSVRP